MIFQKIQISKINPAPYNPRKDLKPGDREYEILQRSIEEFGLVDPLIWNKRTGHLVGGHQRFKIILSMGIKDVDVSVVDLDEEKEKALNIALNKISGTWDLSQLKEVLVDLDSHNFDLELTGFSEFDLKDMIDYDSDPKNREGEDEAPPLPKKPITKHGDLYVLGQHRLLCGDSTKLEDVSRLMGNKKAFLLSTDPPYGVSFQGAKYNPRAKSWDVIENDDKRGSDLENFLKSVWLLWLKFMDERFAFYCWTAAKSEFIASMAAAAAVHVQS